MLYVTTREKTDVFTSNHALREERGKCGGCYLPYRLPILSADEINALPELSFGERVAKILNLFFAAEINGWDVEFAVGRHPVRVAAMSHKIAVIELWHNPEGTFESLAERLFSSVAREPSDNRGGEWFRVAARIAVLFGIFGELIKTGIADLTHPVDAAMAVNDFEAPMAAWYARKMGLPLGTVICCCNENSGFWDFLHHGELQTAAKIMHTTTPDCDQAVPAGLERLIYEVLGFDETRRFISTCSRGGLYDLSEEKLSMLKKGLFCAVVRQQRVESVVRNVYKTNSYLMDPYTALGFGGLQDYRAALSETGPALILSDNRPLCAAAEIGKMLNLPENEVKNLMNTL